MAGFTLVAGMVASFLDRGGIPGASARARETCRSILWRDRLPGHHFDMVPELRRNFTVGIPPVEREVFAVIVVRAVVIIGIKALQLLASRRLQHRFVIGTV